MDKHIGYVDAVNPDLGKFKSRGGKLLLSHGWADTGITPETTIWYYESVLEQDGQEPERLDAALHGAGNGSLRRRSWRQHLRLHRYAREVGGKGCRSGSDHGNRTRGTHAAAVPVSAVCGVQGKRRFEKRDELGVQSARCRSEEVGNLSAVQPDSGWFE